MTITGSELRTVPSVSVPSTENTWKAGVDRPWLLENGRHAVGRKTVDHLRAARRPKVVGISGAVLGIVDRSRGNGLEPLLRSTCAHSLNQVP